MGTAALDRPDPYATGKRLPARRGDAPADLPSPSALLSLRRPGARSSRRAARQRRRGGGFTWIEHLKRRQIPRRRSASADRCEPAPGERGTTDVECSQMKCAPQESSMKKRFRALRHDHCTPISCCADQEALCHAKTHETPKSSGTPPKSSTK